MTVCNDATHDEIVYDEQRYRHISGDKCPVCKMAKMIEVLEARIKDLEDAE